MPQRLTPLVSVLASEEFRTRGPFLLESDSFIVPRRMPGTKIDALAQIAFT